MTPDPRIQAWGQGLDVAHQRAAAGDADRLPRLHRRARTVPVISHEIGQWCVYPNFDEMAKYTGYLKPQELRDLPRAR